jgi:alpha-tubulin suppressor-like RCC1 family protein
MHGQLGNGTTKDTITPGYVKGLTSGVAAISLSEWDACALTTAGGVKCWGWNAYGQLGNGTTTDSSTPVDVIGLTRGVASISTGFAATCAVTSTGGAKCWGYDSEGQLGNGRKVDSSRPVDVTGLTSGVAAIDRLNDTTCALTTRGGVKCWGDGFEGQLGNGTFVQFNTSPVDVSGLTSGVVAISGHQSTPCALTSAGGVKCWGWNGFGQLGNGTTKNSATPKDVSGLTSGIVAVDTNQFQGCAVTSSGGAKCWGNNHGGELGNGTTTSSLTPVDVTGLTTAVGISTGLSSDSCALTSGGGAKCWGSNPYGQLGDGTMMPRSIPVDVILRS